MKQRLTFYLLIFLVAVPGLMPAQTATDTIPTKRAIYKVEKEHEKVFDIARKLNADPLVISWLNNGISGDSVLTQGQTLVYAPNETIEVYTVKKNGEKLLHIAQKLKADPQLIISLNTGLSVDSALSKGQTVAYIKNGNTEAKAVSDNKKAGKPAKTTLADTIVSPPKTNVIAAPNKIDTELIQNQILLTDATLDLNRALLQGIQASLDSLNIKDKNVIDEKNIALTIHRMQRQRDKAMLTPVLLHMQDSLKNEILRGETEKANFEKMLASHGTYIPPADTTPKTIAANNIVVKTDTVKPISAVLFNDTAKIIAKTEIKEPAVIKKDRTESKVTANAPNTGHVRQVIEVGSSTPADVEAPVMHWETAKAIYFGDDSVQGEQNTNELTSAKPAPNNTGDTTAYKPVMTKEDSAKAQAGSDEARIIRARYFYTKALKDIAQKNYSEAVSYLKKSIDLSPRYYEAWLALGEADAHLGLYTKALNEFKYCQSIDSTHGILFYKMGIVQNKLRRKTEALSSFNRALKLEPDYIPAIISRAAEYADRGQFKTAIREYNRVLQLDPAYHTIYKQRGIAHLALKNYEAAIDDFSRFLIFNETDASVYYRRGIARLEQKQITDACADFTVSAKLGSHAAAKALAEHCK